MDDWFQWYVHQTMKQKAWPRYRERYLCPCCCMPTLRVRAAYDLCLMCDWEDDGQDSDDADVVRGGPNIDYSLREARENFKQHFTMYRPGDALAYDLVQMDRPAREQLYREFAEALSSDSDARWQRALAVEQRFVADKAKRERTSH